MTDRIKGTCQCCEEEKEIWLLRDDIWLCEDCMADEGWTMCDRCEDFYILGEVEFTDLPDGRTICEYCMEDYPWDDEE